MQTVRDPLRGKMVAATPEEQVRQWFIGVLCESAGVPMHMMRSEVPFKFGDSAKQYRADIVVYTREMTCAAVVECKRPDVALSESVLEQALRYNMVLDVGCIIITNGSRTYVARRRDGAFRWENTLPTYEDLCNDND